MFCQKCGTQLAESATACGSCNAVIVVPSAASVAVQRVEAASKDAWHAFKLFVPNPVPGLPAACQTLGQQRAFGAGLAFAAVFTVCFILAAYRILPDWDKPAGLSGFMRVLLAGVVPVASLFAASLLVRKAFHGTGGFADDSFISGAACLPFGCLALLAAIFGRGNLQLIMPGALFAGCLTILMLFGALTRLAKISERAATLAVPLILITSTWVSKVTYVALLKNP